jgi:hypothetical protein
MLKLIGERYRVRERREIERGRKKFGYRERKGERGVTYYKFH